MRRDCGYPSLEALFIGALRLNANSREDLSVIRGGGKQKVHKGYSKLVSNCPGSFLIVLAVVFVVLVVVLVVLEVVLEQVEVVASRYRSCTLLLYRGGVQGRVAFQWPGYAQTLILVNLIVVKIIRFLVITRNPVGISGPY